MKTHSQISRLVVCALLAALSIVFGKYLSVTLGFIRFSFENLPILMGAIFFGPLYGAAIGAVADLVGCLLVGYSINPLITLGAACTGFFTGLVYRYFKHKNDKVRVFVAGYSGHVVGSMVVKSIGLRVFYQYAIPLLLLRIPNYIIIGGVECAILCLLLANGSFRALLAGWRGKT